MKTKFHEFFDQMNFLRNLVNISCNFLKLKSMALYGEFG